MSTLPPPQLILASGSPYRAELLARLRLPFTQQSPDIDEAPLRDETSVPLAQRLALAKAQAISTKVPGAWVIGSDQVCACEGRLLGKPGTREKAIEQLHFLSGIKAGLVLARSNIYKISNSYARFFNLIKKFS